MSSKALRLLQKEKEKPAPASLGEDEIDECAGNKNIRNVFNLLIEESDKDEMQDENEMEEVVSRPSKQRKTKKKKRKNKPKETTDSEDVEAIFNEVSLREANNKVQIASAASSNKDVLKVEHKYLNQENELKKIFGAHILGNNKKHHKSRNVRRYRLVNPRPNWGGLERSGISMELVERRGEETYFDIEHGRAYREVQKMFLDAVESADPSNITNIVRQYPFHVDSLLQICEICKLGEDWETAAEIIERAVHVYERSFHPLFSLTQGSCRLEYARRENRGLYLSLFQYLTFLGRKGCYRTSLEYCKLILSFSPDSDPLGMMLLLDFYALRADEFGFLVEFYEEWNEHKNLFQLPNFAFSYPLALFHLAMQTKDDEMLLKSDERLCDALLMYPGMLRQLLGKCNVNADDVDKYDYFKNRNNESEALKLLVRLYVVRAHACWKDLKIMAWLERNVRHSMDRLGDEKELIEHYSQCRTTRYKGTPRNIYRHLIISDIKELSYELPASMAVQSIAHYDPLPPPNSTSSYEQTNRSFARNRAQGSSLSSVFLQSLLPSFDPNDARTADEERGAELVRTVGAFMDGLRGLLNSMRYVPPTNENPNDEWEEDFDD